MKYDIKSKKLKQTFKSLVVTISLSKMFSIICLKYRFKKKMFFIISSVVIELIAYILELKFF